MVGRRFLGPTPLGAGRTPTEASEFLVLNYIIIILNPSHLYGGQAYRWDDNGIDIGRRRTNMLANVKIFPL